MRGIATFFIAIVAAALAGAAGAAAQTIEGLKGPAAAAIRAEVRRNGFDGPITAHVFYGDLTGTGTRDAISFVYYPTGGNSDALATWIWRDTGAGYVLAREPSIQEVHGLDPRAVRFSPGRISVTMTVPRPGDPRCCPTGKRTFSLRLDPAAAPPGSKSSRAGGRVPDVPVIESGSDGQMATCVIGVVRGLNPRGDGFLSVRSGPGTQYRKLGELYNDEIVEVFEVRGDWAAIVYRTPGVTCVSRITREVPYENRGWVHTGWLEIIAD